MIRTKLIVNISMFSQLSVTTKYWGMKTLVFRKQIPNVSAHFSNN